MDIFCEQSIKQNMFRNKRKDKKGKKERERNKYSIVLNCVSDDQSHTGAKNSFIGIGKSSGVVQRFLQQIHYVFEGQDAERKSTSQRLQPSRPRYGSVQRQQRQQSVTG